MEDFLFGLVANGTGVIENQVGFLHGFHLPIALMHQRANDFFRVMDVHLAAKGLKVKRFLQSLAHSSSIAQQNGGKLCNPERNRAHKSLLLALWDGSEGTIPA